MTALYNVKNGSRIRLLEEGQCPPDCESRPEGEVLTFDHIDGMYSYCIDEDGNPRHLAAWTEVEVLDETS